MEGLGIISNHCRNSRAIQSGVATWGSLEEHVSGLKKALDLWRKAACPWARGHFFELAKFSSMV